MTSYNYVVCYGTKWCACLKDSRVCVVTKCSIASLGSDWNPNLGPGFSSIKNVHKNIKYHLNVTLSLYKKVKFKRIWNYMQFFSFSLIDRLRNVVNQFSIISI